jgi:Tol biopolymer transport system component
MIFKYLLVAVTLLTGCAAYAQTSSLVMLMETPPGISTLSGGQVLVIRQPTNSWSVTPNWTPDGRIIFISDRSGTRQIWIRNSSGTIATQIGNLAVSIQAERPQMGRDGTVIFSATTATTVPNSNQTIFVMNSDGSGLRELTQGMQPSIAPSGKWIAFTRQTDVPYHRQIYRINVDGTGEQQLTDLGDANYPDANAASISPDETQIAIFSGKEQDRVNPQNQSVFTYGYRNVAVIPATGGARRLLTACKPVTTQAELQATTVCIVAENPTWTPDGKSVIFDIMFKNSNETWMINTDKTNFSRYYSRLRGVVGVALK